MNSNDIAHLIVTKDLVCSEFGWVYDRHGFFLDDVGVLWPGDRVGELRHGPDLPIDDLDIVDQWRELQEWDRVHSGM